MQIEAAESLARAALPLFGLPEKSALQFVKYRENHVFRADTPAGTSYAVKLHRPGYHTDAEILTELRYVQKLTQYGLPVPQIQPTTAGDLFATVKHSDHSRSVSVVAWLNGAIPSGDVGEAFSGADFTTAEDFARIGDLLGRLHRAAHTIGTLPGFQRGAWDANGLAGPAPLWGDPRALPSLTPSQRELLNRTKAKLHSQLTELGTDPAIFGMVHGDSTPENILVTPQGPALIDFDDFGTGWYLFDLTTALFFYTPHPKYAELRRALLEAYEQHRPLTEQERAAWEALMLARSLTYLGWAAERPGDEASEFITRSVASWTLTLAEAYDDDAPAPYSGTPAPALSTSPKEAS